MLLLLPIHNHWTNIVTHTHYIVKSVLWGLALVSPTSRDTTIPSCAMYWGSLLHMPVQVARSRVVYTHSSPLCPMDYAPSFALLQSSFVWTVQPLQQRHVSHDNVVTLGHWHDSVLNKTSLFLATEQTGLVTYVISALVNVIATPVTLAVHNVSPIRSQQ